MTRNLHAHTFCTPSHLWPFVFPLDTSILRIGFSEACNYLYFPIFIFYIWYKNLKSPQINFTKNFHECAMSFIFVGYIATHTHHAWNISCVVVYVCRCSHQRISFCVSCLSLSVARCAAMSDATVRNRRSEHPENVLGCEHAKVVLGCEHPNSHSVFTSHEYIYIYIYICTYTKYTNYTNYIRHTESPSLCP